MSWMCDYYHRNFFSPVRYSYWGLISLNQCLRWFHSKSTSYVGENLAHYTSFGVYVSQRERKQLIRSIDVGELICKAFSFFKGHRIAPSRFYTQLFYRLTYVHNLDFLTSTLLHCYRYFSKNRKKAFFSPLFPSKTFSRGWNWFKIWIMHKISFRSSTSCQFNA